MNDDVEKWKKGWERYETIRRMDAQAFSALWAAALKVKSFDELVDEIRPFYFPAQGSK